MSRNRLRGTNVGNHTKEMEAQRQTTSKTPAREFRSPLKGEEGKSPAESQLISFGDRMTYVFAFGKEVASIHFDKGRGEIFYKGHNIRNMDIEEWQMQLLERLRSLLASEERGRAFVESYGRTLDKIVLEKRQVRKL